MKVKIALATALAFSSLAAQAAPFLVCDPYPANIPLTSFQLTFDNGSPINHLPVASAIHYDVGGLSVGQHTVTAKACNAGGCSASSTPFTFAIAATAPAVPVGLRLSPQ